jgi:hypothetical protein
MANHAALPLQIVASDAGDSEILAGVQPSRRIRE